MIAAAAQTIPHRHDTEANIRDHIRYIETAAKHGVKLIVFPEMSLTGYEREHADMLNLAVEDSRLGVLRHLAVKHEMVIAAGAPIKINDLVYIGAFVFLPSGKTEIYTKQFLHTGEELFFAPGFDHNPLIATNGERISFAICADISNPLHPKNAADNNTTLYAAGIFYTPGGIATAHEQLSRYASQYEMNVIMANYGGPSYDLPTGARSACWNKRGELVGQMEGETEGLLIVNYGDEHCSIALVSGHDV